MLFRSLSDDLDGLVFLHYGGAATLDLPPGTAEIRLSLVGYETETITVDVTEGASLLTSTVCAELPIGIFGEMSVNRPTCTMTSGDLKFSNPWAEIETVYVDG